MDEHRDENMSAFGSTTYPNLSRVGEEDTILNSIENQEVSTGNTFEKPNCSDLILKGRTSTGDLKVRGGSLEKENYSSSSYSDTIMEDYSLYQENSFSSTTTAHPNLGNYKVKISINKIFVWKTPRKQNTLIDLMRTIFQNSFVP